MWRITVLTLTGVAVAQEAGPKHEIILGETRVQALSPTLLRVELKGPRGFEDRPTFTVVDRDFEGIPIWKDSESPLETVLSTGHYKVHLQKDAGAYWQVYDRQGTQVYDASNDLTQANINAGPSRVPNLLHWPSPMQGGSYGLVDFPRFTAPKWGTTPMPVDANVEEELRATNGFDFRNNVDWDVYVFLLGDSMETWSASRQEFLKLTGPVPLLPDYAYGTWFTRWYNYTQKEAEEEVEEWDKLKLPLDVWGLDMNWRNTTADRNNEMDISVSSSDGSDWHYDRQDSILFPSYPDWFKFLEKKGVRTYFNDHPYPVASRGAGGLQTSKEEVDFRWEGLSRWLKQGLTFWWFDRNWRFSVPPPFVNSSRTGNSWDGLDNAVWGSYIYYKAAEVYDAANGRGSRPMSLTKFAPPDWTAGAPALGHQEHPAHHRFPVWWTGDGVSLQASVEAMVDAGVHDFKPFVHSDCGGDYRGSAGDMLRWTAHCAFGSITRFHGSDHRPWSYDEHTLEVVRQYLQVRYRLLPSLIAAGHRATETGFPFVARGDLYWPDVQNSSTNLQYIFLDDLLVAPIWDSSQPVMYRGVWIPPGVWEDVWTGSIVEGPTTVSTSQPLERQPMWYKHDGGLIVLADKAGSRVDTQDWSSLTLEAFPGRSNSHTTRFVYERDSSKKTKIEMTVSEGGKVRVNIEAGPQRAWTLRVHLLPGQRVDSATIDGSPVAGLLPHLTPEADYAKQFPLQGSGTPPAPSAGAIAELQLSAAEAAREVVFSIVGDLVQYI
eukprot:TRINITY_DN30879_c0_g1_i1.p1 TRINITY_DN30879_c0_g1~~TRINITY_DN30879_c0_g1_i1.p1  ORF type:complete len:772 (-),score=157.04 TRINITY_DN30879_c0_g1_i1:278-2593(-)